MNIIGWVFLGLVAGALAKMIYPGSQGGGLISTMVLGIVGAFIGGSLYTFATKGSFAVVSTGAAIGSWLPSLLFAVIGSMIAIFVWGLITRNA
jgi:uncharacterized membrane protein YeaQ/YmgE (transglycosylase-associated protein family)